MLLTYNQVFLPSAEQVFNSHMLLVSFFFWGGEGETNTLYFRIMYTVKHQFLVIFLQAPKAKITKALKQINTLRRYGLTGTALQNEMTELWCVLDW